MPAETALLIFPHQLFADHPGCDLGPDRISIIEDGLFFGDAIHPARFHKQKLWFHRASMMRYQDRLSHLGVPTHYVEHDEDRPVLREHLESLVKKKVVKVILTDPHDHLINRRLRRYCDQLSLDLEYIATPMFLNSSEENREYRSTKKRWFMADFYKFQRRRLDVLMEGDDPEGGQWSFDEKNRKKVPKKMLGSIPKLPVVAHDDVDEAARVHIQECYENNPGTLNQLIYPTSHEAAAEWLGEFLNQRFSLFGDYEDAIVKGENWLWHSVITPMLNVGLLTPHQVLTEALSHAEREGVPLNAVEGFVRQVIGWREFMRATYEDLGVTMRTTNHWSHTRSIPQSFYDGTTGIDPIDDVLKRVIDTGYCHHIERLMVLGGFMFLCEFDPKEIYTWFMEMFVDSYDWVMVPNVYAMSQHADGGSITTKPYFSGSAYVRKMSNYPTGEWASIWDGLYWRWIWNHVDELAKNPRWAMMCAMARKMPKEKLESHLEISEGFLSNL